MNATISHDINRPQAGVLVPLFAIRGAHDLGVGDVRSLREFIDWCAEMGFGVVNLLPLNEPGADPSPYNPISAMAIDPLSISLHPDDLEDVTEETYRARLSNLDLRRLSEGPVRYPEVRRLKSGLLEAAFETFDTERNAKLTARARLFHEFVGEERAWLRPYTLFRILLEQHGHERWPEWPEHQRNAAAAESWLAQLPPEERAGLERRATFYSYVQWIAQGQWLALHQYATDRGVALMGDIPLGVSFYSADVFTNPELFDLTWSCGAPPDAMSTGSPQEVGPTDAFRAQWGQNWGFPFYNWARMREDGLLWWRRRVARVRAFFDLFRIDHILGFYRVYAFPWRPEQNEQFIGIGEEEARRRTGGRLPQFYPRGDDSAASREANRSDGESLLRILIDEVGAAAVIGEDLGCVPDYVRPSLRSLGIAGYKVPMWEQESDGALTPGKKYESLSVAMYVTHDHAPLRAQWNEWARSVRRAARGRGEHQPNPAAEIAAKSMRQLWEFTEAPLSRKPPVRFTNGLHRALIAALLRSNSSLAIFMITDLFARTERFNVPGAVGEANWTQRMHVPIKELGTQPETRWLRKLLQETGRAAAASRGPSR